MKGNMVDDTFVGVYGVAKAPVTHFKAYFIADVVLSGGVTVSDFPAHHATDNTVLIHVVVTVVQRFNRCAITQNGNFVSDIGNFG
ncbi:hypothetical protein SDC9_147230 [bioreactor metagenome]|uniref:Uncharacterized protein n=1 Tax=bioreactor metagenome TaxID=1076179 RepID=A0A645EF47_9ZZZZ